MISKVPVASEIIKKRALFHDKNFNIAKKFVFKNIITRFKCYRHHSDDHIIDSPTNFITTR